MPQNAIPRFAAALTLLLLRTPALPARQDAGEAIARGDAAWDRRAEGHVGANASPGPIGEAIAAYEQALKAQPERLECYWKLLRAEHYRGQFVAKTREQKQAVFGPARLMFGSDWPNHLPEVSWKVSLAAFTQSIGAQPIETREQLLGGTAQRFYGLPDALPSASRLE